MIHLTPTHDRILQIEHDGWGMCWLYQFPESIPSLTGWVMDFQPIQVPWRSLPGGGWSYGWRPDAQYLAMQDALRQQDPSGPMAHKRFVTGLALRAEIRPDDGGLAVSLSLTNESGRLFERVDCDGGCFQAQHPLFTGEGEVGRTFVMHGGKFVSMGALSRTVAERCTYHAELADYDRPPGNDGEWFWGRCAEAIDEPTIVGMISTDERHAVAYGYGGSRAASANADAHHHCLHSRPFFGDIAPGETVTRRGWILFGENLDQLGATVRQRISQTTG